MTVRLGEAEQEIRQALERLAESPIELRCYVVVEDLLTKRFVQFCTPPPPSPFVGGPQLVAPNGESLIFDGTGSGKEGGYTSIQAFCDIDRGVLEALDTLRVWLPEEAELRIIEESSQDGPPS